MLAELFQPSTAYRGITESLLDLYLSDRRLWLVGFSGGNRMRCLAKAACFSART